MDKSEHPERRYDAWRSWAHSRPPWRQENDDNDQIRGLPEWWELEAERFDGERLLQDAARARKRSVCALALARLLVLQVALRCIRRITRGEDIIEHVAMTRSYLRGLPLARAEHRRLQRVLTALQPFDPAAAADALMGAAWSATRSEAYGAQSLLEAAYECACGFDLHAIAAAAADAFAGLARMHECPRAARKWQGRAYVHARRAARCYAS